MKASEYIVNENDTVQKIAGTELGSPARWLEIVTFNRLTYPYVSNTAIPSTYASGNVTFSRTNTSQGLNLPIGTQVKTSPPENSGSSEKIFKTTAVVNFSIGETEKTVNVQAEIIGSVGNVSAYAINEIIDSPQADLKVENGEPLTNGKTMNVKTVGDKLLIPQEISTDNHTASELLTLEKFDKEILGQDLFLDDDGNLERNTQGDFKLEKGLDLYEKQLRHRLLTPKGSLTYRPEYGSNLHLYLGGITTEYTLSAVKREVIRTLNSDARTKKVYEDTMVVEKLAGENAVRVEVECEVVNRQDLAKIGFSL